MSLAEDLSPDQIEFTNAFNRQRGTLAGFAKCRSKIELDIVRDALYLGLARDVLPKAYEPIAYHVVTDSTVAAFTGTSEGMATMIAAARLSDKWNDMVQAVQDKAAAVGSDLEGIWKTLEQGRLQWLQAVEGVHSIKKTLNEALLKDNALDSSGDVSDAKMVWIYGLSLNICELKEAAALWSSIVQMPHPTQPLVGYNATLWDSRKDEWRPLDLGVQAAAERGGSTLEDAWNA